MQVIKEFKCLMSGKLYFPGSDYPENDPDRVDYLCERGFLAGRLPVGEDTGGGPVKYELPGGTDEGGVSDDGGNAPGGKAGSPRQKRGV